jgi:phosphoribosylamine--glycine ligase
MTILLLGSGGREHAFAWKMIQSPLCDTLLLRQECWNRSKATNVDVSITDFEAIKVFVLAEKVEMIVVGPEDPLVKGIYDFF